MRLVREVEVLCAWAEHVYRQIPLARRRPPLGVARHGVRVVVPRTLVLRQELVVWLPCWLAAAHFASGLIPLECWIGHRVIQQVQVAEQLPVLAVRDARAFGQRGGQGFLHRE